MPILNLLVIRAQQPEKLAAFYSKLGLTFHEEQHGSGPKHFCSSQNGVVFEIYPLKNPAEGTQNTRIGFLVDSIDNIINTLEDKTRILVPPTNTDKTRLGTTRYAVLIDPEGHKVELVDSSPMSA
jgi:lactoylglutathione lyase